jgi:ATP phosphoribosyltransferase regulatory subunit
MIAALPHLHGSAGDVLSRAREQLTAAPEGVAGALDEVATVVAALHDTATDLYLDLAELRGYHYQTGIVFAIYGAGSGQELARGGRYDDIGAVFGRARPATGFSADLLQLMDFGDGSSEAAASTIFADVDDDAGRQAVAELRAVGERVIVKLSGQMADAQAMGCQRQLVLRDGGWQVEEVKQA